ncbi:MAG: DUF4275 family protein [Saprospiraceae bacterium]|nr:DUF4275 family protein [Saprospiraceae bacterium]
MQFKPSAYQNPLELALTAHNVSFERLDVAAVRQLKEDWKAHFWEGRVPPPSFLWHIYSFNLVEKTEGPLAVEMAKRQNVTEVLLFEQFGDWGLRCYSSKRFFTALLASVGMADLYLVPADMRWTLAFTHEWLGPYFKKLPERY